ncbi:MAG: hypothetical protein GY775_19370 [Candidatus Scalindua sp.]|nr:hypothetical protein [Candidatus Scalindua sp.]
MDVNIIEVDDTELLLGDENLKLDSDKIEEKDTTILVDENDIKEEENDVTLLEVDDSALTNDETEDTGNDSNSELEIEDTDTSNNTEDEVVDTSNENGEDEDNPVSAFGTFLAEEGMLPDIGDEELSAIEDSNGLLEVVKRQLSTEVDRQLDNYKRNVVQNLIKDGYISSDNVIQNQSVYSEDQIKSDVKTAKSVIETYYKKFGTPDKTIKNIIDSTEDLEEIALELNEKNKVLEDKEKAELADKLKAKEEAARNAQQQLTDTLKDNTFNRQEFIPGKKLRKNEKEEVFLNITPTMNKINGNLAKYAPIISYLDKYGILEGDFSKVLKEGASQNVDKFTEILREKKKSSGVNKPRKKSEGLFINNSKVKQIYK